MEREVFAGRLRAAAAAARDFARTFIEERLPDACVFRLRLNSSYDGNPRIGDEVVFPEDSSIQRANELQECDEERVVACLWRDGRVPEWINVSVIGETGNATRLELLCCGRFTAQEELLYHEREGRPPFHVLGPTLPVGYVEGQRFSIYDRAECSSIRDVDHLRSHAHKVWSLELFGSVFGDRAVFELPDLQRMEILELKASPIEGSAFLELHRFPRLRVLRVSLAGNASFRIPKLPAKLRGVEVFDLEGAPAQPWGFAELVERLPKLSSLTLRAHDELHVDGTCPRSIQNLSIAAKQIAGGFKLPKTIDSIYAHLSEMSDSAINDWLSPVKEIRGLDLSGTPITDSFAESLPSRFALDYLNVVDTQVSEEAVRRIATAHPKLKLLPNLKRTRDRGD